MFLTECIGSCGLYDGIRLFRIILALLCTDGVTLLQSFLSGAIYSKVTGEDEAVERIMVDPGEPYWLSVIFFTDFLS